MSEKYALLGFPLKHTMSPPIHKRLFELAQKEGAVYEICETEPEKLAENALYLNSLNGYNITIPFKVDIIKYLDEIDCSAEKYYSVNCVARRNGKNVGYNTDCIGFRRALEAGGAKLGGRVLQIGCGGVGRMMAVEAAVSGADITISVLEGMENTAEPVVELARKHCAEKNVEKRIHIVHANEISGKFDLLVNATPVGMFPKTDACPVSDEIITNCGFVFDVIYNPDKTQLMKKSEDMGIKAIGGMSMLVWQAVVAHEIWDGSSYKESDIDLLTSEMTKLMNKNFG